MHKGDAGCKVNNLNSKLPYSRSTRLIHKRDLLSYLLADCQIYSSCCQICFGSQGGGKVKSVLQSAMLYLENQAVHKMSHK